VKPSSNKHCRLVIEKYIKLRKRNSTVVGQFQINVVGINLITNYTQMASNSYAISSVNFLHIILITVEKITVGNSICLLV
jgi:hypothetical protein